MEKEDLGLSDSMHVITKHALLLACYRVQLLLKAYYAERAIL